MKTWNLMNKWHVKRLLDAIIELSRYPKPYDTKPAKIIYERIAAVLRAYMLHEKYDEHLFDDVMTSFCNGDFMDCRCSREKLELLGKMTGYGIYESTNDEYNSLFCNMTLFEHRRDFFKAALRYRLNMEILFNLWSDEELKTTSVSYCAGVDKAFRLAGYPAQAGAIALDKILVLLLGDRFDFIFHEDDLRANFGYPEMTDSDLYRLLKR